MDLELRGKAALVTGGNRGIGFAVGRALAAEGAQVALRARDAAVLEMEQQASPSGRSVEAVRAEAQRAYALGRIAQPEDVADLVCFLASARASFLTGICVTVDGGATRGMYP